MTTDLINNLNARKEAFMQVYLNHPEFYEKNKNEFIKKLRDVLLDTQYNVRNLENNLTAANETISQLKSEKDQIEQSTFWRITKPARFITDALRRKGSKEGTHHYEQ